MSTREANIYSALDEAMAAGAAWLLEQLEREPDADELAFRQLWQEHQKSSG